MSGVFYATPGTGKLAYAIGWIDLGDVALTPPLNTIPLSYSLPRGISFSFDVSTTGSGLNTATRALPTWSGAAMGIRGYLGIGGKPAIYGVGNGITNIKLSNIVLKDRFGNIIPEYAMYIADAEGTASAGEGISFRSDGKPIWQVDVYPDNFPCPPMIGDGTSTITIGWTGQACSGNAYNSRIFQTTAPKSIIASLYTAGGGEAMALGVSIQQMKVYKEVLGRVDNTDQFELKIIGNNTVTTITTGVRDGVQEEVLEYFGSIDENLFVTESMAIESKSKINAYETLVTIVNTAGGSIPSGQILNNTIPLHAGDFLEVKITNIPIKPYIKPIKAVDKDFIFQGEKISYTIILPNTSPNDAINVVFKDTVPIGGIFVDNSIKINGVQSIEALPNINVGRIKANSVATITFEIIGAVTTSIVDKIVNSGVVDYSYPLVNSIPKLENLSNEVVTKIGVRPNIIGLKEVDLKNAKLNTILTYTLAFTNKGVINVENLKFIDSIPSGTTFIDGSLSVNGINKQGVNPIEGFILDNPTVLKINETVTIAFKVKVTSIFEESPYKNKGTLFFEYITGGQSFIGSTNTNIVETVVKYVDVFITKYVDKLYADLGDTIVYKLKLQTVGNMIAENMIFKDTIPIRTSLIGDSVYFNGVNLAGASIEKGINLGNINPNTVNTIEFSVLINKK